MILGECKNICLVTSNCNVVSWIFENRRFKCYKNPKSTVENWIQKDNSGTFCKENCKQSENNEPENTSGKTENNIIQFSSLK